MPGPRANNWFEVERMVMEALEEWTTGTIGLFTDS